MSIKVKRRNSSFENSILILPDILRGGCYVQLGMGTVIVHYFTGLVSSLLKELGLSDDMFNPVSTTLLLYFSYLIYRSAQILILSYLLVAWPYECLFSIK